MEKKKWSKKQIAIIGAIAIFVIILVATITFIETRENLYISTDLHSVEKWYQDIDEEHLVFTDNTEIGYMDNRIIILFAKDATKEQIENVINSVNGKVIGQSEFQYQIEIKPTANREELKEMCNSICNLEGVLWCFEDSVEKLTVNMTIPNDPWKDKIQGITGNDWDENKPDGLNWWAETIQLASAWDYNERFNQVKIAVLDGGFDTKHEDLDIVLITNEENAVDKNTKDHGTHVAGIIGATANNSKGISGIVWNKEIYGIDIFATDEQIQNKYVHVLDKYQGIYEAIRRGCKVINLSIGAETPISESDIITEGTKAAAYLLYWEELFGRDDFIIVQSAGNSEANSITTGTFCSITDETIKQMFEQQSEDIQKRYSSEDIYKHIIIVGAVQKDRNDYEIVNYYKISDGNMFDGDTWKTRYCYGDYISIVAPGRDIFSTVYSGGANGNYGKKSGTSMAAPIVTGVASLVWSVNPNFTAGEVKDIVCNYTNKTAKGYGDDARTYPIVNAKLAVEEAIRRTDDVGTLQGVVKDNSTNQPLKDVIVTVKIKNDDLIRSVKTDENGIFSFDKLPAGIWNIMLSSDTHTYDEYAAVTIEKDIDKVLQTPIYMIPKPRKVTGTVKDSNTNKPISNVKVEVIDNKSDSLEPITTATTDENGKFALELPKGNYSVSFNHNDYEYYGMTLNDDRFSENGTVELEDVLLNDKIKKLTNDDAKKLWERANEVYCTWKDYYSFLKYVEEQEYIVLPDDFYGEVTYYRVKHNKINSLHSLNAYLSDYFSESVCKEITSYYIEYEGNLYFSEQCGGTENCIYGRISVENQNDNKAIITVEFIDSMSQVSSYVDHNIIIRENNWIFTDFVPCYNYDEYIENTISSVNNDMYISEDIKDKIILICEQKFPEAGGTFVIFDDDITETNTQYYIIVRIQRYDANADTGANLWFTDVTVDKSTGKMYINNEYIETLW